MSDGLGWLKDLLLLSLKRETGGAVCCTPGTCCLIGVQRNFPEKLEIL